MSGLFTSAWIARPLHWANTFSTCDTHLQQYAKMRGILQIKEENGCRRSDTDETLPLPPGALCFAEHRLRLPFRYLKHTSKLIRKLGNSDLALHHNKVVNLKLAVASIDGVVIGPGEYFSFAASWVDPPANAAMSKAWRCHLVKPAAASVAGSAN